MHLLIKYATRQRPKQFLETLYRYYDLLSGQHWVDFVISYDEDDTQMNNREMSNTLNRLKNLTHFCGPHKTKIEAINANVPATPWDIVLLASDDMQPQIKGYDDIIAKDMTNFFPDYSGCLHYNDGRVATVLNTLSIMGRKLYDRFGYIYNPAYLSLWCDNEYQEVTEAWGKAQYLPQIIIKHEWDGDDPLVKRNQRNYLRDQQVFKDRKRAGFPDANGIPTIDLQPLPTELTIQPFKGTLNNL